MSNPGTVLGTGKEPATQGTNSSDSVQSEYLLSRAAAQRGNDNWIRALAQGQADPQAEQGQPASPQSPKHAGAGVQAPTPMPSAGAAPSGPATDQSAAGPVDVSFSELMNNWPSQMALGHKILSGGWAAAKDMTRGAIEAAPQVIGGAIDAFNNLSSFAQHTAQKMHEAGVPDAYFQLFNDQGGWEPKAWTPEEYAKEEAAGKTSPFHLPTTGGPESVTGNIIRAGTTFLTGRGSNAGILGAVGGVPGSVLRSFASGAMAMDPNQPRLSNVINQIAPNFVTDWLKADPKDEDKMLGHLKSGLEYSGLDTMFAGAKGALQWLKGSQPTMADHLGTMNTAADNLNSGKTYPTDEQGLPPDSPEFANAKTTQTPVSPSAADQFNSIKPDEGQQPSFLPGKIPDDLVKLDPDIKTKAADYLANKTGSNPAWINLDRLKTPDDVKEALARVATQLPEIPEQSNETTKWLANSLGVGPEDFLAGYKGQNLNASETTAMRLMLDSSAQQLVEHASAARISGATPDAEANFLKAYATHSALQQYAMNARAEAGRTLQSWSIMADQGSQYTQAIQNIIQSVGEKDIKTMASQISDLSDPLLVNKYLSNTRTMTGRDAILYGYNNLLLSNPRTIVKKLASDTTMALWNLSTRYAAEKSPIGMSGEIPDGETGQLAYGYISSLKDGIKLAGKALRTGERQFLPYSTMDASDTTDRLSTLTENAPENLDEQTPTKNFGELMKMFLPTRQIGAVDDFAKYVNYRAELRALAYRSGVGKGLNNNTPEMANHISDLMDTPPPNMHQQAISSALKNTFQEPLTGAAEHFQKAMDGLNLPIMHTDMQVPVGRIMMPFIKVPFNIMKFAYRNSPLAAAFPSSALTSELQAGGATRDLALSKMALGSAVSLSMADMALSSSMTGKGPSQYDAQAAWRRAGNQPYSVKINGNWYGYNNMEPFGLMMGTIADTFETARYAPDDHDLERASTSLAFGLGNAFLSKTYMQGLSNFFEALENPEADSKYYSERLLSSFVVPQGVSGLEKATDPWMRSHYDLLDTIASRTPGLSQNLPPARTIWGDPIPQEQGFLPPLSGTGLARMISPISVSSATGNQPIDKWVWDNREVFPHWDKGRLGLDAPSRTFSWSQNKLTASVLLNPAQYDRLRVLAGNGLKDGNGFGAKDSLNALVSGNYPDQARQQFWNEASPAARSMMVLSIWNKYSGAARKALMQEDPALKAQIENGLQQRVDMLQSSGVAN